MASGSQAEKMGAAGLPEAQAWNFIPLVTASGTQATQIPGKRGR